MTELRGKRVLITGAARGIGLCTAEQFARAGCELVLTDLDQTALDQAADRLRELGPRVHVYTYDVSDQAAVQAMARRVVDSIGGIDVLINNAGIGHHGELAETSLGTWRKLMEVNFWGPLYHIHAFLPHMKRAKAGHIVNVSSGQAFFRLPTWGAYATTKVALGVFSEILHFELRRFGIVVTTVYPFMVNTGFYNSISAETLIGKLSMKLVPFYSMRPERVGRIIFDAVRRRKGVEMVSMLNELAFYAQCLPVAPELFARISALALAKKAA